MKCNNCGFENREGVKFCEECGQEIPKLSELTCSNCGFENRLGVRFCEECGTPLIDMPTPQTEKQKPPAPSPIIEQSPITVTTHNPNKNRTWIWAMVAGVFIVFAFLFLYLLWPSLSTMRISLNNNNNQSNSVQVVEESGQVIDNSNEASPAQDEPSSEAEPVQQSSQVEEPVLVEEETNCNRSKYVRETIPDNTVFQPGEKFQKTWTVRNEGECTWNTGYTFEHTQGAYLNAETNINMPKVVKPGDEVTLSLDMQAPDEPGTYIGRWEIFSDDDEVLGWYSVVIDVIDDSVPEIFSVTSVNLFLDSNTEFSCTSACADISASGTGMVTYKWEDTFIGEAIESDATYFDTAGTKTVCSTCFAPGGFDVSFYVENPNNQNFGTISIPLTF